MAELKLLPCPMSGHTDSEDNAIQEPGVYVISVPSMLGGRSPFRVECACGVKGPTKPTPQEAITAWNTRPAASPITDEAVDDSLCHDCGRTREQHDNLETRHPLCATFVSAALPLAPREGWQEEVGEALEPFADFAANNTDDEGWAGNCCQNERIVDWFGPSDFRRARKVRAALSRTGEVSRG